MRNEIESRLIDEIDEKRLMEVFLPAIKHVLKSGGGADAILKNSEAMAATRLSVSALTGSPETSLKAAIEILNRTQGRPVERRLNLNADLSDMTDDQLDREIYLLAKRTGVKEEVIEILQVPIQRKQRTKAASLSTNLTKKKKEKAQDEPRD